MDVNTQGKCGILTDLLLLFFFKKKKVFSDFGWPEAADAAAPAAAETPGGLHEESAAVLISSPIQRDQTLMSPASNSTLANTGSLSANYLQQRMPAFPTGNYPPGPGSAVSGESSRDDLTSVELEQVFEFEERFRVDRRKLELLILGRFDPIKESATDFFLKV